MEEKISYGSAGTHTRENPTHILSDEDRVIDGVLAVVERLAADPAGTALDKWRLALEFFREFADGCHHVKEEKVLFPALEEHGIPVEGGPLGMMLAEHEQGREHVRSMVAALNQLQAGKAAAHESLVTHAASYTTLLREHIQKEYDNLFRMADEVVPESDQKELLKRFEAHEAEEMGAAAHDRYLKIAHDLEHT